MFSDRCLSSPRLDVAQGCAKGGGKFEICGGIVVKTEEGIAFVLSPMGVRDRTGRRRHVVQHGFQSGPAEKHRGYFILYFDCTMRCRMTFVYFLVAKDDTPFG